MTITEMTNEELNSCLAVEVMGWEHKGYKYYLGDVLQYNDTSQEFNWYEVWNPTENLNQAMECAEKFPGYEIMKHTTEPTIKYRVRIWAEHGGGTVRWGKTPARTLSETVLQVIRGEE